LVSSIIYTYLVRLRTDEMHEHDGRPSDPLVSRLPPLLESLEGWGTFRAGAKAAAVAAVLFRREGEWYIPFVIRRRDLPSHPGQIGLPGGGVRLGEEAWQAAAREVEEEIGVPAADLVPLGAGSPLYAAVTNFSVVPFVAWLPGDEIRFRPDPRELDGVLEVPLDRLLDREAWLERQPWPGPHLPVGDSFIWGLTARLLADLLPRISAARGA
jgi:8-oxo-dGTP pyrophosphatase MutT (NUDIX family)